jgi:HK97 family phage major capsid protein
LNENFVHGEAFVIGQGIRNLTVALDAAALNGPGGTEPTGLLQNSAVQTASSGLSLGSSGGVLTYDNLTFIEETLGLANADAAGGLGWACTPNVRRSLRKTNQLASGATAAAWCWQDSPEPGVGRILGHTAIATTNVPNTLTAGSGTALSALIAGYWPALLIGLFHEGIDFLVNPYVNQSSGAVQVSLHMACDVQPMHGSSFFAVTNIVAA